MISDGTLPSSSGPTARSTSVRLARCRCCFITVTSRVGLAALHIAKDQPGAGGRRSRRRALPEHSDGLFRDARALSLWHGWQDSVEQPVGLISTSRLPEACAVWVLSDVVPGHEVS